MTKTSPSQQISYYLTYRKNHLKETFAQIGAHIGVSTVMAFKYTQKPSQKMRPVTVEKICNAFKLRETELNYMNEGVEVLANQNYRRSNRKQTSLKP